MHFKDYKTILSPGGGINVYRGCSHGCIYCDSRSLCYKMTHDFEDVEVKRAAPEILERQLRRRRERCVVSTGSMCDPYSYPEEDLKITRQCLEVIYKYGYGVSILTKSSLIERDIDILRKINERARCVAEMTMTTFDESLCRVIEPNVSTTRERFETLRAFGKEGIPTVVWLSPILPFINDTKENLLGILDYCSSAGVKGILCFGFGVTLRDGDREYFYKKLDEIMPGIKERYIKRFGGAYICDSQYGGELSRLFAGECGRRGIMHNTRLVLDFIKRFDAKEEQLTLF